MNYEMFKEKVKEEIISYMPEEFKNLIVDIMTIKQESNGRIDKLILKNPDETHTFSINLNDIYKEYIIKYDFKEVLNYVAKSFIDYYKKINGTNINYEYFTDTVLKELPDRIFPQVINIEYNRKLLESVPHIYYLDFVVVFRVVCSMENGILMESILENTHLDLYNKLYAQNKQLSEVDLFTYAKKNFPKIFPIQPKTLYEVMKELFLKDFPEQESAFEAFYENKETANNNAYVLTTSYMSYGASYIFDTETMEYFANKWDSDLFICPSSIKEIIVLPANLMNERDVSEMIKDVNKECPKDVFLSNTLYKFYRDTKLISMIKPVINN